MSCEVILKLDGIEVRTTDEVTVQTVWSLIGTAVSDADRRTLGLAASSDECHR